MIEKMKKYQFLFEELVKRDFKTKYKRTVLGMVWSILSPLLNLFVMRIVFTHFFGGGIEHYTTYLFCGNLVFSYFSEASSQGMTSLLGNAGIFSKVNVPKYLFLFSKNVQTLINFGLTLCVFFVFCVLDQITFTWKFILLPVSHLDTALLEMFNFSANCICVSPLSLRQEEMNFPIISGFIFFTSLQSLYQKMSGKMQRLAYLLPL